MLLVKDIHTDMVTFVLTCKYKRVKKQYKKISGNQNKIMPSKPVREITLYIEIDSTL